MTNDLETQARRWRLKSDERGRYAVPNGYLVATGDSEATAVLTFETMAPRAPRGVGETYRSGCNVTWTFGARLLGEVVAALERS